MTKIADTSIAAVAPIIWGTTYYVTTAFLPADYPLTAAMLRALPAGLLLLLVVRQLPSGSWWWRVAVLGALNFSLFFPMLYVSAYRLPGGVAATIVAAQPLIVVFLSHWLLRTPLGAFAIGAALLGLVGVAMTVLTPSATLDPVGVIAGLVGAASMAAGVVLSRRWQPPVTPLTFAAWQLTAGGLLLVPVTVFVEPSLPPLSVTNIAGFAYLTLIGGALTYILWLRGISHIDPPSIARLALLSPVTATLIGVFLTGERVTALQVVGILLVFASVAAGTRYAAPSNEKDRVDSNGPSIRHTAAPTWRGTGS